jgi:small subunit ribosomal protein S9
MAEERDDLPQEPESGAPDEEPRESEAVGPEIEGMEDLVARSGAGAREEPAADEEPAAEGAADDPAPEGEPRAEGAAGDPAPEGEPGAEGAADEPAPEEAPAPEQEPAPEGGPAEPVAEGGEGEPAPGGEPAAEEAAGERPPRERRPRRERRQDEPEEEVIPGMHLEPDLVLEEAPREETDYGQYAAEGDYAVAEAGDEEAEAEAPAEPEPVVHTPLDLAADARYNATGKRKSAVARVILKPGEGTYSINGRHLDEYFPRVRLQRMARQPLEAAGYQTRMDVVARIHGGGVSAQATALRHGIARALVEADPALRGELKRRGYLTRDPRVKERKKAGLKKARKRPQFSKR